MPQPKDKTFAPRRHGDTEKKRKINGFTSDRRLPGFHQRAEYRYFELVSASERGGHGKTIKTNLLLVHREENDKIFAKRDEI
jgi:hypothetical protein